jgi:hypothetical protein
MSTESIRLLIGSGFFTMLLPLRLEAERFGAAEYDEPKRGRRGIWTRLAWYAIGLALLAALYVIHPSPRDVLFLVVGHRSDVIAYGALLALLGLGQAVVFAWFRYGYLRLPPARAYPGAAINSIATAAIDEATFRGALLGSLVAIDVPGTQAVLIATIIYVLATRLAAPERSPYALLLAFGIGLAGGWATLASGGIGAPIIGHAIASFAIFVCTGHAGQIPRAGREPEEVEFLKAPPQGWQDARRPLLPGRGAEPRGIAEQIEASGYAERVGRRKIAGEPPGGIAARIRLAGRASRAVAEG